VTAHTRIRHLTARLLNRENVDKLRAYASFEDALRDSDSYEDPALIEIVKEKTKRYKAALATASRSIESRQSAQNMFVLSHVMPERTINVLEVGGACGASYFEIKHLLPKRIKHWSITETAAMANAGNELNDDPALSLHSDLVSAAKQLQSRDVAIAQGVLQYAGDPIAMLKALYELEFSYVYITRTAVADVDAAVYIKQDTEIAAHGPGRLPNAPEGRSTQPLTLVSYDSLLAATPANYKIVFKFIESEDRVMAIGNRRLTAHDAGFLARLQAQS
jgi:putative methyltransferase (TIGR04325 family)